MNRIRNPFVKRPPTSNQAILTNEDDTVPAGTSEQTVSRTSFSGSRTSSTLSIAKREDPNEYKMSVVSVNGEYLPPSPPEKKSAWPKSPLLKGGGSKHRDMLKENEPFSISRESFESYRRSFDISARSPVVSQDNFTPRQSLDTKLRGYTHRTQQHMRPEPPFATEEDLFEDVGLDADRSSAQEQTLKAAAPRKKGLFARFGEANTDNNNIEAPRSTPGHRTFHLPGRKRGQSGSGAELSNIDRQGNQTESMEEAK